MKRTDSVLIYVCYAIYFHALCVLMQIDDLAQEAEEEDGRAAGSLRPHVGLATEGQISVVAVLRLFCTLIRCPCLWNLLLHTATCWQRLLAGVLAHDVVANMRLVY